MVSKAIEKLFKTMSYAVMALCHITIFGLFSRAHCRENCFRFSSATIAFDVIGFIVSFAMFVFWFIAAEIAVKVCIFVSFYLFVWTAIAVAFAQEINPTFGSTIAFLGLVTSLLVLVFNLNFNPYFSVKVVSETKVTPPPDTVDPPPTYQEESQA